MTREAQALIDLIGRNHTALADLDWYADAHELAAERAARQGLDFETYAAVVAATSPSNRWFAEGKGSYPNLDTADRAIRHYRGESGGEPYPGMLGRSLQRAFAILNGDAPDEILGPKTRAFWHALLGSQTDVVLDRWALRAIGWNDSTPQNPARYDRAADFYREAANIIGTSPAALQAATWTQIRREA